MEPPLGPVIDVPTSEGGMFDDPFAPDPAGQGPPAAPERDPAETPTPGAPDLLQLDPASLELIAKDAQLMLDDYKQVMDKRWAREDEIEDAYALKPDTDGIGKYAGASQLCSELIMSRVDQATARLADQLTGIQPICRVTPLDSYMARRPEDMRTMVESLALSMEQFFDSYSRRAIKIEDRLAAIAHRAAKLGTCVLRVGWRDDVRPVVNAQSPIPVSGKNVGSVQWELISNRDVVIWPPWAQDWQADYEWVGHRTHMSTRRFEEWASKTLNLPKDKIEELKLDPERPGEVESLRATEAAGYELDAASSEEIFKLHAIFELYCHWTIPGTAFPVPVQVFYHEGQRKAFWGRVLESRSGKHPYFPIRYKRLDQSAWGNGIGHELYGAHVADTAFRNLELDNLMSAVLSIVVTRTASGAEAQLENPYPGMRISTDDINEDLAIKSFAEDGPVALLYQAQDANLRRADDASGLPAVLQGQGDPTMKSGAGTGSTLALIQEAAKKFGFIDKSLRRDLSNVYAQTFDLLAQYASPDVFIRYATPEDAQFMVALKGLKPGESVEDLFSVRIEAPSAANNKSVQQQNAMVVLNLLGQQSQTVMGLAQQIFPMMNPAGMIPYLVKWANVLNKAGQMVVDLHDLPGMREIIPDIDQQIPPEQQMLNTLMQQLQQLQQQLQEAQMMLGEGDGSGEADVGADASSGETGPPPSPGA